MHKIGYSQLKNERNYASMLNLGNSSLNKSSSRNSSYHHKTNFSLNKNGNFLVFNLNV